MAVSKSTRRPAVQAFHHQLIDAERRRLNKVVAILIGAELTAEYCPDRDLVNDAIGVARELVEQVIGVLDSVDRSKS